MPDLERLTSEGWLIFQQANREKFFEVEQSQSIYTVDDTKVRLDQGVTVRLIDIRVDETHSDTELVLEALDEVRFVLGSNWANKLFGADVPDFISKLRQMAMCRRAFEASEKAILVDGQSEGFGDWS